MKLMKVILAIFLVISAKTVLASSCQQSGMWNWYEDDFRDFDGRHMDKPWFSDSHIGASLINSEMCYEDGWRVLARKFKCEDFYENQKCADGLVSRPGSYKPKFALYNIYTGLARFFFYVDSAVSQTQKIQVSMNIGNGAVATEYGLLLNDNSESISYENKTSENNVGKVMIMPALGMNSSSPKWLVFDKYISYEPLTTPSGLFFNVYLHGIEEDNINLNGNFNFKLEEILPTQERSILETAWNAKDDVVKAYTSIEEMGESITNSGYEMYYDAESSANDKVIANSMISFGDLLLANSGPIGAVAAAASLVKAFSNTAPAPKVYMGSGDISLSGSIFSQYPLNHRTISVPNSDNNENDHALLLKDEGYNASLGLFHFSKNPKMAFRHVLFYEYRKVHSRALAGRILDNLKDLIVVNPATGMKLKELKIMPYLETENFQDIVIKPGESLFYENPTINYSSIRSRIAAHGTPLYYRPEQLNPYTDELKEYPGSYWLNGGLFDGDILEFSPNPPEFGRIDEGNLYINDESISGDKFLDQINASFWSMGAENGLNSSDENSFKVTMPNLNIKMKVYLLFEHESNSEIFAEFVRIVDVDEYYCNNKAQELLPHNVGYMPMEQCMGEIDSDNDGILDWVETAHGWDPFDPSNALQDDDYDFNTNIFEINAKTNPFISNGKTYDPTGESCDLTKYYDFKTPYAQEVFTRDGHNYYKNFYLESRSETEFKSKQWGTFNTIVKDMLTGETSRGILTGEILCEDGELYDRTWAGFGIIRIIPSCYNGISSFQCTPI